jgi:tetratricopeptide (TPR) repeat protein
MHRLKGDLKEAQHAFGHAFELNRGCIAALLGMGRCWFVLKDYPKALKCFDKVLELNYQHVDCLLEKGRVLQ